MGGGAGVNRVLETGAERERKSLCGRLSGGKGEGVAVVPQGRYQSGGSSREIPAVLGGGVTAAVSPYNARPASRAARERERERAGRKTASRIYREYRVY